MARYDKSKEAINYSRVDMSTEFFFIPVSVVPNSPTPELDPSSSIPVLRSPIPYENSFFRREIWVPPLLVLSVLTMILIVLFEVSCCLLIYMFLLSGQTKLALLPSGVMKQLEILIFGESPVLMEMKSP